MVVDEPVNRRGPRAGGRAGPRATVAEALRELAEEYTAPGTRPSNWREVGTGDGRADRLADVTRGPSAPRWSSGFVRDGQQARLTQAAFGDSGRGGPIVKPVSRSKVSRDPRSQLRRALMRTPGWRGAWVEECGNRARDRGAAVPDHRVLPWSAWASKGSTSCRTLPHCCPAPQEIEDEGLTACASCPGTRDRPAPE